MIEIETRGSHLAGEDHTGISEAAPATATAVPPAPLLRHLVVEPGVAGAKPSAVPTPAGPALAAAVAASPDNRTAHVIEVRAAAASGPPVVLLHGLASNMTRWSELTGLTTLARHHDLIRIDLRGHGESMTRTPFDRTLWRHDLLALLDAHRAPAAYLVGHSLGATVAMDFAAVAPQRVAGLALIDPIFREAVIPQKRHYVVGGPLFQLATRAIRLLNRLGLYRRQLPPLDLEQLDRQARAVLADPAQLAAFVRRYSAVREDLRHIPHANYLQDLVEMFRPLPPLNAVTAPVLVMRSTMAGYQDEAAVGRRLAQFPQRQIATIDCHHWPVTERPAEVRRLLEDWIDRLEGRSAAHPQGSKMVQPVV